MNPKARSDNLTIRELPGETVIYDLASKKVHCLNRVALFVWKNSDGRTSIGDLAARLAGELSIPSAYEAVELALEQLSKRGLLVSMVAEANTSCKSNRRAALKQLAKLAAIPTILTLAAPKAMAAASADCEAKARVENHTSCLGQLTGTPCQFAFCSRISSQLEHSNGRCQNQVCE